MKRHPAAAAAKRRWVGRPVVEAKPQLAAHRAVVAKSQVAGILAQFETAVRAILVAMIPVREILVAVDQAAVLMPVHEQGAVNIENCFKVRLELALFPAEKSARRRFYKVTLALITDPTQCENLSSTAARLKSGGFFYSRFF